MTEEKKTEIRLRVYRAFLQKLRDAGFGIPPQVDEFDDPDMDLEDELGRNMLTLFREEVTREEAREAIRNG